MPTSSEKGIAVLAIVIAVVALVAVGAGSYFALSNTNKTDPVLEPENEIVERTTTETGGGKSPFGELSITMDVTTKETCGDEGCFAEYFTACNPASLLAESPLGSIYYEILEPKPDGCSVKAMYTEVPNPEWVNKEMICTMDNSLEFLVSIEKTFNEALTGEAACEGPLAIILSDL